MKKVFSVLFGMLFLAQGLALAAQRGTAEYEKLKEYKKSHKARKIDQPAAGGEKGFWAKEAQRSGLAGTGAMFGNAIRGVVPHGKPASEKNKV